MSELRTALPRVTIEFCTQCKWMLRAAYFAQELLSTFSTSLGEVALQPSTGGTFIVHLYHAAPQSKASQDDDATAPLVVQKHLLWDRKAEGGFPETKELKRRVRDIIEPSRHLGHIDSHSKEKPSSESPAPPTPAAATTPSPSKTSEALEAQRTDTQISGPGSGLISAPPKPRENQDTNAKVVISGGDKVFYCKPGDEDCG